MSGQACDVLSLWCDVSCLAVVCHAVLNDTMLCYAVLCCAVQCHAILSCSIVLCYDVRCCPGVHCFACLHHCAVQTQMPQLWQSHHGVQGGV